MRTTLFNKFPTEVRETSSLLMYSSLLIYSAITACMTNVFAFRKRLTNREMEYGPNGLGLGLGLGFAANNV